MYTHNFICSWKLHILMYEYVWFGDWNLYNKAIESSPPLYTSLAKINVIYLEKKCTFEKKTKCTRTYGKNTVQIVLGSNKHKSTTTRNWRCVRSLISLPYSLSVSSYRANCGWTNFRVMSSSKHFSQEAELKCDYCMKMFQDRP